MKYINEYKYYEEGRYNEYIDTFEKSIICNNYQIINLIIILCITIIYPILIKITSRKKNSFAIDSNSIKNGNGKNKNKNSQITSGYDSNKLYSKPGYSPLISDNYDTPNPGNDNQYYQGETPYYQ